MPKLKRSIIIVLTACLSLGCLNSMAYRPRNINISGSYKNPQTDFIFTELWNGFYRQKITSFNKDASDIGITYTNNDSREDLKFTVFIYPAPVATEHRIQGEFYSCLKAIAIESKQWIHTTPGHLKVSKDGYKVLGLTAAINQENFNSVLVLFECGKFFLKYRISSSKKDTSELNNLSKKLITRFSPIDIVKKHPLNILSTLHVSPGIVKDTACLDAVLAAAAAKIKWVYTNVDSLEKCSGYPSLYFEEQKIPIDSMLREWESSKHNNTIHDKYFNDLIAIRDSGFLNEFIYDQYEGILLLPDSIKLNMESYEKWRNRNHPTVKLVGEYYYYLEQQK